MSNKLEKLKKLLAELFQFDNADLDFGIYRIMNYKRDEIQAFLHEELLPQVGEAFAQYEPADKAQIQKALDTLIENLKAAQVDPEQSPKVQELRKKLAEEAVDIVALENEVYSHLFSFFRRYYSEGDFISLRRYKEGVYAIPYEGEEVKLYWANHDQYYIKSSEYLRDYSFLLSDGRKVHFKLVSGDSEKDNTKAAPGQERRFILLEDNPVEEKDGELFLHFEFQPAPDKRKQKDLNDRAVKTVLEAPGIAKNWHGLGAKAPTPANPSRSLLEKHLTQYAARNTFDYFIHKDLGGFLRRELDFYIKNEVMHLDDIENETAPRVEQYLSKIKVIRAIAHKIIAFVTQIEEFQKKLWLKKKFVVETNYCITLDRVPEALYPEIAANDAQRVEWVNLFAIDKIKGDLLTPKYAKPLSVKFLKANDKLVLDTRFFGEDFKTRLIASIENLDERCDGLLIRSDNFQALKFMNSTYRNKVKCAYIDPPYNTSGSEIMYKNDYKHSSWIGLLWCRMVSSLVPVQKR
ncbi:MAG: hypothetical protein ABIM40_14675 [Pseudomonadota bacterium]